jgi:uncharacterized phage protein (TIGR02220 family)
MKSIIVPIEFFQAIGEKPAIIRIIWIKWLAEYSDQIFRTDFVQYFHLTMKDKNISIETINEAYELIRFFDGGFKFIDSKKSKKVYNDEVIDTIDKVIQYLNLKSGATYTNNKSNCECIAARMDEGFTISEFKIVIERKCRQWMGTEQEKYLRPITLFQAKKFENYLNEPETKENGKQPITGNIQKLTNAANKAKQFFN